MKLLDVTQKQEVSYCIPLWQRDENIRRNTARVKGRITAYEGSRPESIAIVCFGPSLNDTWEQIRAFPYVMSCSGSHRFLLERGIVPNWHAAVDPKPKHTVQLIGPPHQDVEYLISSTCDTDVIDHLEGFHVKLWHVFDATSDGRRLLPPGEWAITGGCDVGLRALTIAGFLGFRDLHVFGMDQSAGTVDHPRGGRHAGEHPDRSRKYQMCEYDGERYWTTAPMVEAARGVWHELNMMPSVKATFYGDGLCQAMARNYVPKPSAKLRSLEGVVAVRNPELISAEYAALNVRLHRENLAYGVGGEKHARTVLELAERLKTKNILDYGCGKGRLGRAIPWAIAEYDPCIEGKTELPKPADIVVCTDVLEHVEPEKLTPVLADLRRCVEKVGYFVIHTGPAAKTLADGRNTHLIQRGEAWWRKNLAKFFEVGMMRQAGPELFVVVAPKRLKPSPEKAPVPAVFDVAPEMAVVTDIQVLV